MPVCTKLLGTECLILLFDLASYNCLALLWGVVFELQPG